MDIHTLKVGDLSANCYFLVSGNELAIVDPGQDFEKIIDKVNQLNKKVKYIILTHYHSDHTQEAQRVKLATNSEIIAHKDDVSFLDFNGLGADKTVKDNDILTINNEELKVIHTPGHSEGSISLVSDDFIITGDTLFKDGHGRTDLPGGSPSKIKKSLKRIRDLSDNKIIYPGHGESFKLS